MRIITIQAIRCYDSKDNPEVINVGRISIHSMSGLQNKGSDLKIWFKLPWFSAKQDKPYSSDMSYVLSTGFLTIRIIFQEDPT